MPSVSKAGEGTLPSSIGLVESLRERVRLLEAVVDNFPGGISLFDKNLRMILCNEQQKKLLDYPEYLFASVYPTSIEIGESDDQSDFGLDGDLKSCLKP
jgi:PAS domain-containing protein